MIPINSQSAAATSLTSTPARSGQAARVQSGRSLSAISETRQAARETGSFPDRPLISARPVRYNVQLNHNITAVQQADNFLRGMEQQVLQLTHLIARRAGSGEISRQAGSLQTMLANREQLSGGTVDRQLQLQLQDRAKVNFSLSDGEALLNNPQPEVLTFSLAGRRREISAAVLEGDSAQRNLLRLNQALGKWGIHGKLSAQKLSFQVDEQRWPQVSQHLSVKGNGERYPQEFYPLNPKPAGGLEEMLHQLTGATGQARTLLASLEAALEDLTGQRRQLQSAREKVHQRIESMATWSDDASALQAAQALSEQLGNGGFSIVSQAIAGQANLPGARVRNVLAGSA